MYETFNNHVGLGIHLGKIYFTWMSVNSTTNILKLGGVW